MSKKNKDTYGEYITNPVQSNGEKIEDLYKNSLKVINQPSRRSNVPLLLFLVFVIFIVSFIIQIVLTSGFLNNWSFFKDLKITNSGDTQIYRTVEQYYIRENEYLATLNERLSPLVVNIFAEAEKKLEDVKEQLYLPAKRRAVATILTADGWLVSAGNFDSEKEKYLAITASGEILKVSKVVKDGGSGVVFLKLEADNLPAVALSDAYLLNEGEKLLSFSQAKSLEPLILIAKHSALVETSPVLYSTSEQYNKYLVLNKVSVLTNNGAPVFNTNGEMVGIIKGSDSASYNLVIPSEHFKKVISQVLTSEPLKRSYLGLIYLDLHYYSAGLDISLSKGRKDGALIINKKGASAVETGSPAAKADLQSHDIITKIEDEAVNGRHNLTELIQEYKPGQKIKLTILRDTEEKVVEVELGSK